MIREFISLLLTKRLKEPRRFIKVLAGSRQVGKTTLARQVMTGVSGNAHYASADEPALKGREWILQQWELGRLNARRGEALLILDEIQKGPNLSDQRQGECRTLPRWAQPRSLTIGAQKRACLLVGSDRRYPRGHMAATERMVWICLARNQTPRPTKQRKAMVVALE